MAYILNARTPEGELPRVLWMESTGNRDGVRITMANGLGTLATGVGRADELERIAAGNASCVCSGDLWLERTENAQSWRLSFVQAAEGVGAAEIGAFEFACALQRIQFERMTLDAAVSAYATGDPRCADGRVWEDLVTTRAIAFDS